MSTNEAPLLCHVYCIPYKNTFLCYLEILKSNLIFSTNISQKKIAIPIQQE